MKRKIDFLGFFFFLNGMKRDRIRLIFEMFFWIFFNVLVIYGM